MAVADKHKKGQEASPVVGKYTYYRKKKLMRKNVGASSQCSAPVKNGLQGQIVKELRKEKVPENVTGNAEVEHNAFSCKTTDKLKVLTESSHGAKSSSNLPTDCSSAKMSYEKPTKVPRTMQSMFFS